jgi:anti-sigma regulatory factor (Ser/Thr protein kinase)
LSLNSFPLLRPPGGLDPGLIRWQAFPAGEGSVQAARRVLHTQLEAWRLPGEVCADAVLLLSELTTNAVLHAGGGDILCGFGLVTDARLRLEVHDHGPAAADLSPRLPGPWEESGRGLFLVHHLAHTWGADRSPLTGGNAVWATLALRGR